MTWLVILALIKMCYDQWRENKLLRQIEDYERHYYEEEDPLA